MRERSLLRERISKKYLDLAEMLPKFNGGIIASWQRRREHQRKDSERTFQRTRPAAGISLYFDRLLLVELFFLEDIETLERELRGFFIEASPFGQLEQDLRGFSTAAGDLYSGRWQALGHITRQPVNPFFYHGVACMPHLPEEVSRIFVSVMKVLPSTFALSFEVELSEKATNALQALLNQKYLPRFSFGGILPTRRTFRSSSELPSEQVMENEIRNYFSKLRVNIEEQLSSRMSGIFLRSNARSVPKLPAVQMLSIAGTSQESGKSLLEVLQSSSGWARSFGFTYYRDYQIFYGPDCLLQLPEPFRADKDEGASPYLLVSVRKAEDRSNTPGAERQTCESEDVAHAFACLLSISGLIETTRQRIQRLRILTFQTLSRRNPYRRIRREIRLNDEVQIQRMILRRLQFELSESKWVFGTEISVLDSLKSIREEKDNGLGTRILGGIEWQLKRVCGHAEVISREISGYLQRRNLDLTFRLQKQLFWWSAVLGTLTVLTGAIAAYAATKDWPSVQHLAGLLHKLRI